MANDFIRLNLNTHNDATTMETRGGLTLLDLKSAPACPTDDFIPQEFTLLNLPGQFFRRGNLKLKEALAHELAFRCLAFKSLIAQDAIPTVQMFDGMEWVEDRKHPALPVLRNPNLDNTASDLLSFVLLCEDVFGVAYLEKIYSRTGGVIGLNPLDPRTVREIGKPGAVPFPIFWTSDGGFKMSDLEKYQINEGAGVRDLDPDDVIAMRLFDVRSPLAGYSSAFVAFSKIGLGRSLDKYIDCYLTAGGPSGIYKVKNKRISDIEAKSIQDRLYRDYAVGGQKSGKVMVVDEDGEFEQIGGHLSELGNDSLRYEEQAAICTAFGVPGQLVHALYAIRWGNQRAGQESAIRQFWDNTMSPTLTRMRSQFDKYFLYDFDGQKAGITTRVFYDLSNVKALQEDLDKKAGRYNTAYGSKAVSKNEYRAQLGLQPVPGGDFIPNDEEAYEAAQQRLDAQPQGNNRNGEENDDSDDDAKNDQKKSLEIKREATDLEKEQTPAVKNAQDEAAALVAALLLALKTELLDDALEQLRNFANTPEQFTITLTPAQTARVYDAIADAFRKGAETISDPATPDRKIITELTTALGGVFTIGFAARLVQWFGYFRQRRQTIDSAINQTREEINAESKAWYESQASGAAFQAVADGRHDAARRRRYVRAYYSAILDGKTCDPCAADDGKWSDNAEDLPPVPNPDCKGRWRCRCCWVYVFDKT